MYLSKSVEVDCDIELTVDDIVDFIEYGLNSLERNKIIQALQEEPTELNSLHAVYYRELMDKLVNSGKHPFEVERILVNHFIL